MKPQFNNPLNPLHRKESDEQQDSYIRGLGCLAESNRFRQTSLFDN
jgi:hypothetical protein